MTTPYDPNDPGRYGDPSGLPNFPAAPPPSEGPAQVFTPPREIMAAFWCYVAAAVVILIGGVLSLGAKQTLVDTLRDNNTSNLSPTQIDQAASVTLTLLLVVAVIVAGLFLLFAFKLRAGRNWARIVLAIIAILELISLLNGRGSASILSYIGILAAVIGAVLSWMPNASQYIAAVKRNR
ncbi:MAG TPA: hypothetical protein VFX16_36110 [Pseudonocardiaceae bacterium]|nr:hypothetical protein [Pseudonocardiaceae bacterium]